jgi:internalin A
MTPDEALVEALRRIAAAKASNATLLDLGDLGLAEIPPEIGELSELRVLALGRMRVREGSTGIEWEWANDRPSPRFLTLAPLRGLVGLTSLDLSGCERLSDVSALSGLTALTSLNLSSCEQLLDVSALSGLTALTSLKLIGCEQLSDVSALSGLTALTSLNLSFCMQLSDVSALSGLTALTSLDLLGCSHVKTFAPLRPLLDKLTDLKLHGCSFDDLDPALCGRLGENVRDKVHAHFRDAEFQATADTELKLFLLGNGTVGKTQLRRRLCGLGFDPSVPSTHGVEIQRFALTVGTHKLFLNIWDFGGQDVYHGTHALFLQRHAVYVILWMPQTEAGLVPHAGIIMRHRPLSYWLDFVRSVAGTDAPVLIVQSQFDDANAVPATITAEYSNFLRARVLQASAKEDDGLERLWPELKRSVKYLLEKQPILSIGAGRVRVRDQLRTWLAADQARPAAQRKYRTLPWKRFVKLCEKGKGDVSSPEALADFLRQTGFLFYDARLFHGEIILDQGWALEAIYAVFHRDKSVRQLRQQGGRFTRENLGDWLWDDAGHSSADQERFLTMMLSCGICFPMRKLSAEGEWPGVWQYAAPDHLPTLAEFVQRHPNIELPDPQSATVGVKVDFRFLHDGLLRTLLARMGEIARNAADYWRYGCYFRDPQSDTRVRFDSTTIPDGPSAAGSITFSAWGGQGRQLLEALLAEVQRLSPAQAVQPQWSSQAAGDTPRPGAWQPSCPAGVDSRVQEDHLAELMTAGRPGLRQAASREPPLPESVQLIDALAELTEGQLASVASGLEIKPADLPQADLRTRAVEIHRRAGLDRSGQRLQLLRSLILNYNPEAFN